MKLLAARLRAQGLKVWLDVDELTPGRPWQEALEEQIESIHAAAVLVGKDGIGPWQSREMRSFLDEFVEHGKAVIPVLLDGCPETPKLPIFLKHFTWVDCRGDNAEEGFWRLVWGITGKKPKELSSLSAASSLPSAPAIPQIITVPTVITEPGGSFRDPLPAGGEGPDMLIVPAGSFRMGDISGGGSDDERPVHTVSFAQSFAIGRHTVTFAEYDRFAQATGRRLPNDFGWGRERRPVVDVSWEDACAYALWLAQQTGKPYRLPSEAEWEYAARAGTETAYWWGNDIGTNRANCAGSGSQWSGKQTAPVGSFAANPWGLHDTVGNVWEWTQDRWHGSYADAPVDGSAWGSGDNPYKVRRGGCWGYSSHPARASSRYGNDPGYRYYYIGFRLVCASPHH